MVDMNSMMGGMRKLGKNPKADLYDSFKAIRLQLAQLRETASRDDSAEAQDVRNSVLKFAEILDETGLLNYVIELRNKARENSAD